MPNKEFRFNSAKQWLKIYSGKNLVKGYSKKFGVDKLCAIKELRIIGIDISQEYEKQIQRSYEDLRRRKLEYKLKRENDLKKDCPIESDENFAVIIGYTSNGVPFGTTHDEMDKIEE